MITSILPSIVRTQTQPDSVCWRLSVTADLVFFNGHFPQQPVLPGVTQLDWAIKFGCQHFGYPHHVATLEVLKFQQLILPNTEVDLTISHQAAKAKLTFAYTDGEKRFASGRIALSTCDTLSPIPKATD